jgi:hypothetical protein
MAHNLAGVVDTSNSSFANINDTSSAELPLLLTSALHY